ncbi:MAG: FecR domain-containing protein [Deltaproteobacteria bacterium]|jgi:ferric-dicitrate binding protein FerR (iron transport regulator)|nr:FecR domain-containing protein [Deltaproteobacteria bacterium]MBT6490814.1 FecR domain-containing protein [Deltaproteobacteria bacterium]
MNLVNQKLRTAFFPAFLVCLSVSAGLFFQHKPAEAKVPVIGEVTYLRGESFRASAGSSNWLPLKVDMKLHEGDRLQTKKSARIEARLTDGSVVRLGQNTQLSLQKVVTNQKGQRKSVKAKLLLGKIWASVKKAVGAETEFSVTTDHAVAGVRGTRFETVASKTGTSVKVYSGAVLVSNKPIYAIKGHTKKKRVQVAGPQLVSKKKWKELITGAMQVVKVSSSGAMQAPAAFTMADKSQGDWEAWNAERDAQAGIHE